MTGFDRELRQKVIDFDAHILVSTEDVLRDWRSLKAKIDHTSGVVATAPYIQGPVIVEFQNRRLAPMIRGIDPVQEEEVIPLQQVITCTTLNFCSCRFLSVKSSTAWGTRYTASPSRPIIRTAPNA